MKQITLLIDGMHCSMCEAHVNDIVRKTCKVKKVKSSHRKNQTIIICDESINSSIFVEEITKLGYRVLNINEEIK